MALEVWEAEGVAGEIWGGLCPEPGPLPEAGEGAQPKPSGCQAAEALGRWGPPAKIKIQALSLGH